MINKTLRRTGALLALALCSLHVQALKRNASSSSLADDLTYTYSGNRITKVEDAAGTSGLFSNGSTATTEYTYDNNGNLKSDLNKGISNITYNCLNLPLSMTFSNGSTIAYTYDANGRKLRTVHNVGGTTTTTDYAGNVIYENGVQKKLLTEEGYVDLTSGTYYYYLKDHQGNNRVVVNSGGTVTETNHYYPFGGTFASGTVQPYKYNGKELDTKAGLNWYDYGARHYDAALGRFTTQDPLAKDYYATSPYGYCLNNPVKFVDVKGMFPGPGDLFTTPRAAAKDWGMYYNGASILRKREMGSTIYEVREKGLLKGYSYTNAKFLDAHGGSMMIPDNTIATIHSHGEYTGFINIDGVESIVMDNSFSATDIKTNQAIGLIGYLATPRGILLEHNPQTNQIVPISADLPSDYNDPGRLNKIEPIDNTRSFLEKIIDALTNIF